MATGNSNVKKKASPQMSKAKAVIEKVKKIVKK